MRATMTVAREVELGTGARPGTCGGGEVFGPVHGERAPGLGADVAPAEAGGESRESTREIKGEVVSYWTGRVEGFSRLRVRECEGELHLRWLAELERRLPACRVLRILDVGCGTGFFSLLLSSRGHVLTGIDLTPGMVAEARRLSERLSIPASFEVMDAEAPDFPAASFDAIVTRNLTWSLPHLGAAYAAWHALLVPGGVLVNFDADYCRENGGGPLPAVGVHRDLSVETMRAYERIKDELRPSQRPRPAWDLELLSQAGFTDVDVDGGVWRRVYRERDEFFNPTPIFAITARA